jgi:predicted RNA-binding protein with PUA-like domain
VRTFLSLFRLFTCNQHEYIRDWTLEWIRGNGFFFTGLYSAFNLYFRPGIARSVKYPVKYDHMAHWLAKSEPSVYPWDQLVKDKQTVWSGIRNYSARIHLKAMKKGDEVFFYHSNIGMEIVGIATVAKEYYQDPTTDNDAWVAVDLKAYKPLKHPVSLARIKTDKRLADMALIRLGRLSVQPVTDKEWEIVMEMSK